MLSSLALSAKIAESWKAKETALDRAKTHVDEAKQYQAQAKWDKALHSLTQAKVALKRALQNGPHIIEAKRLLTQVHLMRVEIGQLGQRFTIDEIRTNYHKALGYCLFYPDNQSHFPLLMPPSPTNRLSSSSVIGSLLLCLTSSQYCSK